MPRATLQCAWQESKAFRFGPFYLSPGEHLFLQDGKRIPLRPKLFETLLTLVANAGRLLTKDELMARIWPDVFVQESGLARNISDLRHILSGRTGSLQYVETVPKVGYRFVAAVAEVGEESLPAKGPLPHAA